MKNLVLVALSSALALVAGAARAAWSWNETDRVLSDGTWKLKASIVTVTNGQTGRSYRGYELASSCALEGAGVLDLSTCAADTGMGVVSLASSAFPMKNTTITKFVGPDVVKLGPSAFRESLELESCEVSSEIFYIGDRQFLGAVKLARFVPTVLPELSYIGTTNNSPSTFYTKSALLTGDFFLGKVTYINSNAFQGTGITSIEAPVCVHAAGSAFQDCASLTNAVLPRLRRIESSCFVSCAAIRHVEIDGANVESIGANAFSGVGQAEGLPTDYPKLVSLGADAFRNGSLAGDVSMPLVEATDRAFAGCTRLTSFFGPSLASYGYMDFYGCSSLTNVTLDGSASFWSLIPGNKRAPGQAFAGCTSLKRLVWLGETAPTNKPNSNVFSLAGNAKADYEPVIVEIRDGRDRAAWEALCTVKAENLTDEYRLIANYPEVKDCLVGYIGGKPPVKNGAISGQYYADKGEICWIVDRPTPYEPPAWRWDVEAGTCTDGEWTFRCTRWDATRKRWENTQDGKGVMLTECLGYTGSGGRLDLTRFAETTAADAAAYGVTWGVTGIGRAATSGNPGCFEGDSSVTEIIAPEVVYIAPVALQNAVNLRSLTVSEDATSIFNERTFSGCTSLTNISPKTFAKMTALAGKRSLEKVPLVGDYVFPAVSNLASAAFYSMGASDGRSLSFPELRTLSASGAFQDNVALTNFYAPKLTNVLAQTFQGCLNLQCVTLSPDLREIGSNAFIGLDRLVAFSPTNMPELVALGNYAFNGAAVPCAFGFPKLPRIGERTFADSHVRSVSAPQAALAGKRIFQNCTNLVSLAVRGGTSLGGDYALSGVSPWCVVDWLGKDVPDALPTGCLSGKDDISATRRITVCLHRAVARRKWLDAFASRRKADFTPLDRSNLTYPGSDVTVGVCDGRQGSYFWMTRPERVNGFLVMIDGGTSGPPAGDDGAFDVSNAVQVAAREAEAFIAAHPDGTPLAETERPLWELLLASARASGNEYAEYRLSHLAAERVETPAETSARAAELRGILATRQRDDGLFRDADGSDFASAAGNGALALELVDVLRRLAKEDANYDWLYDSFEMFVEAVERRMRADGLWGADLDAAGSSPDWYASARIGAALMTGATQGLIAGAAYAKLVRTTWLTFAGTPARTDGLTGDDRLAFLTLTRAVVEEDRYGATRRTDKGIGGQDTLANRADGAKAVPTGVLRLEPTYTALSVTYGAVRRLERPVLQYRAVGATEWKAALEPLFFRPGRQYRGSIVNLAEGTDYEVRILDGEAELASAQMRTWATDVPVAKTVEIDTAARKSFPISVQDRGTADGWVRYVPKDPSVPLVNETTKSTFDVRQARFVLIEGFTIDGGWGQNSIAVNESDNVRIRNCEIFHFGPGGLPTYSGGSKGYCTDRESGLGDQAAAIVLNNRPTNVTVERCLVHSPRGRANSWRYSHPYGAEGVQYVRPDGGVVIRWCDFIASDTRRWEDALKCRGNDGYDTGINRNADICGNFIFCCNDDGCELDGGQQNVRFFGNRVEEVLMGVSIQYNQTSPSYVYDNLFSGLGTEFWHMGSAVKTSSVDRFGMGSASFLFNNTLTGPGSDAAGGIDLTANASTARLDVRNNLSVGFANRVIPPPEGSTIRTRDNVLVEMPTGTTSVPAIPNFHEGDVVAGAAQTADGVFPRRPIPWRLTADRLETAVEKGVATPAGATFEAVCGGSGYSRTFRVVKTVRDSDWYSVSPMSGTIASGGCVTFAVTFDPAKMGNRRKHAAAFAIRTDDGFSRPCTIHATTDREEPFVVDAHGLKVVYGERTGNVWSFDLPELEAGKQWFVMVHGRNLTSTGAAFYPEENVFKTLFNDADKPECHLQLVPWWTWVPYAPGDEGIHGFIRAAGRHTITVQYQGEHAEIDGMAMTEDPGLFEPEGANGLEEMK